ncbi:hypothetical protein KM043_004442 [Ampulex compressa]|nr:hypothetical protein KM043_004442 [Ampulex compressa]
MSRARAEAGRWQHNGTGCVVIGTLYRQGAAYPSSCNAHRGAYTRASSALKCLSPAFPSYKSSILPRTPARTCGLCVRMSKAARRNAKARLKNGPRSPGNDAIRSQDNMKVNIRSGLTGIF